MRIAVSGANGFIGRHVVAAVERRGHEPVLWVRPASSATDASKVHRVVKIDLLDPPAHGFDLLGRPNALIHLAWGGLPNFGSPHHVEREAPAHERLLGQLIADGLANLVVAGTCFEYGLQSGALDEAMPSAPANAYATAKDTLRRRLEAMQREQPFALTWARLFYLHGEGQAETALLPQLQRAVASGAPSFPMSGGEQLRDYLPVEAAADALVQLAVQGRDHGIVNVCSGRPVTVRAVVEHWLAEHGASIELELGRYPYSLHEPMAFWGDPTKLHRCLHA